MLRLFVATLVFAGASIAWGQNRIELDLSYTTGFWSNVRGGFQTGARYEGFAQWMVRTELWDGGGLDVGGYSYHGGQPSTDLVGTFFTQTVSGHETSTSFRFYEVLLRQAWGNGRFLFKVGQLSADTDFFVADNAGSLLNGSFGFLADRSNEIMPFYPLAAPGAYIRARTADALWELHAGVYTADPGEDESSNIGFGWSFDNGLVFLAELRTRRTLLGRPGSYALGVAGSNAELMDFNDGGSTTGAYGFYALADQLLFAPTPARAGVGVFLRGYGVPQSDRNPLRWYVDAGVNVTRPFRARPNDALALGFAYLHFSDVYVDALAREGVEVSRWQSVFELTYRCRVREWFSLQPSMQFFFNPHFSRRDATVVGLRAVFEK
jgi:porin